jgi:hypothetical protein
MPVTAGLQQLIRKAHTRPPFAALWCGGMTPAIETPSVVAVRVNNPDPSTARNQSLKRNPNSNRLC